MKQFTLPVLLPAVLLVFSAWLPQGNAVAAPANSAKKVDDPFLSGAPFTFEQLLKLVAQDAIPLHRRKEAILNRGIDFTLTQDQIDKLRAAGASDDILKAIRSKSRPAAIAPPAPPKKDPVGAVAVTCAPAECDISLNGTPLGKTKDGHLEIAKLRPGKWVMDLSANGYISHQNSVTVEADKTVPVSVVLDPNRATLEAFGADLLKKVIQAVAGADSLDPLTTVQATGSLNIYSKEGSSVRWTLLMRNNPDRALFQAKSGSILHEVAFVGTEFKASKNLRGQDALDMPADFGFVRDYQVSAILAKLSDPQFKKVANHPVPADGEQFPLVAENGTQKISINLDGDLRPQEVQITTATGVGAALIAYSDYLKSEKVSYPKTMQIKPEGWQHGIAVHFDNVELGAKLNAADYRLRGKALMNLGN